MSTQTPWIPHDVVIDIRLVHGSEQKKVRRSCVRLCRGAYVSATWWNAAPPWQRACAVAWGLAMTVEGVTFCCATALLLHGLPLGSTPTHLHVARGTRSAAGRHPSTVSLNGRPLERAPGVHIHVHSGLEPVTVGSMNLMPIHEAMTWVLARERLETSVPAADGLLRRSAQAREVLNERAELLAVGTQRRQACGALAIADARSESAGESLSRVAMLRLGVEPPELQRTVTLDDGRTIRPDYTWVGVSVVGEFDGRGKYLEPEMRGEHRSEWDVLRAEKERDALLLRHFRAVVHWTAEDRRPLSRLRDKLVNAGVPVDPRRRTRLR